LEANAMVEIVAAAETKENALKLEFQGGPVRDRERERERVR
jgi:hypothetical protein